MEFVSKSSRQLRNERKAILKRSGLSESELRKRAKKYQITPEQSDAVDALDNIDYLLGGDA